MLEIESSIYEKKLPELVQTDIGKFILIKEHHIIGIYVAQADALKTGYERFRDQPFFVRQILPMPTPLNFLNNNIS